MSNELTKRASPTAAPNQAEDAASRLKGELMADALGRMLDVTDDENQPVPGKPRVILALANFVRSGWDRAKVLQRAMFNTAAGSGLEMKFAFVAGPRPHYRSYCRGLPSARAQR
jgi:hypothetical protein